MKGKIDKLIDYLIWLMVFGVGMYSVLYIQNMVFIKSFSILSYVIIVMMLYRSNRGDR